MQLIRLLARLDAKHLRQAAEDADSAASAFTQGLDIAYHELTVALDAIPYSRQYRALRRKLNLSLNRIYNLWEMAGERHVVIGAIMTPGLYVSSDDARESLASEMARLYYEMSRKDYTGGEFPVETVTPDLNQESQLKTVLAHLEGLALESELQELDEQEDEELKEAA